MVTGEDAPFELFIHVGSAGVEYWYIVTVPDETDTGILILVSVTVTLPMIGADGSVVMIVEEEVLFPLALKALT